MNEVFVAESTLDTVASQFRSKMHFHSMHGKIAFEKLRFLSVTSLKKSEKKTSLPGHPSADQHLLLPGELGHVVLLLLLLTVGQHPSRRRQARVSVWLINISWHSGGGVGKVWGVSCLLELGERVEALLEKRRGAAGEALLEKRLHVHALKIRWEAWVHTGQCLLAHL